MHKCIYITTLLKILDSQSGNDASYSQLNLCHLRVMIMRIVLEVHCFHEYLSAEEGKKTRSLNWTTSQC